MSHEIKKEETNIETIRVSVENILEKVPVDQLLGSVTTYPEGNDKNQSLRSSARVFKKIKLDANLNATPTSADKIGLDKKEDQKLEQTPQKEQKKLKPTWSVEDRVLFFEALNEYGKDFENIHNYIVLKLKKKGVPDTLLITKEHVRHLYYKTWHKISKYLKFSEGMKKTAQELYGLINYGELKKKVGVFTQKINHKLNELIYNGCVAIRVKGKMVRVKTPMCAALRRLNKLVDKDEDLKLPSRVLVELRPKDMSTFLKVQSMALNPRITTVLPLQKKLYTLMTCVSKKWKTAEIDYLKNIYPVENEENMDVVKIDSDTYFNSSQLKFTPPKGIRVNIPKTNLNEYFTRESICLRAFEERMRIISSALDKKESKKPSQKSRADSFSENIAKSPMKSESQDTENQVAKQLYMDSSEITFSNDNASSVEFFPLNATSKLEVIDSADKSGGKITEKVFNDISSIIGLENEKGKKRIEECPDCLKNDDTCDNNKSNISEEEQLTKLNKIQNGWTVDDCDTLTIGELYLMFGSASKIVLEYHWIEKNNINLGQQTPGSSSSSQEHVINNSVTDELKKFGFTDALRKLVSLVKLQQKKVTPKCPCGHVCSPKSVVTKKNQNKTVTDIDEKVNTDELKESTISIPMVNGDDKQKKVPFDGFLRPQSKPPAVQLMAQLDSIQKLKPKYSVRKGRRLRTKQLVVERELNLMANANSAHQIVRMNIIPESSDNKQTLTNAEECCLSDTQIVETSSTNKQHLANAEEHCVAETQTVQREIEHFVDHVLYTRENNIQHSIEEKREPSIVLQHSNIAIGLELSDELPIVETSNNFSALLHDSSRSLSPSGILKEDQWISSEVGDFSLSSFLGHLESPMKSQDDSSHDVDAQVRSLLTENSFDYTAKFADLAKKVTNDTPI